jgi:hypothetical protein
MRRLPSPQLRSVAPVAALVVLELLVAVWLGHGQGWRASTGAKLLAALLLSVQMGLVYGVAVRLGGSRFAVFTGLLVALAPALLAKWYFVTGAQGNFKIFYRHQVLPTEFGLTDRSQLIAACLFLVASWLALDRVPLTMLTAVASAGAVEAAVLVSPHTWPALLAPTLAAVTTRRPLTIAATVGTAGAALVILAVARSIPHVPLGWHSMGVATGGLHEYTWSRRILEYLPIAGILGLFRRSLTAALFLGTLLVTLVIFPLGRPIFFTYYVIAIVPGLMIFFLVATSIRFLVPRGDAPPQHDSLNQAIVRQ